MSSAAWIAVLIAILAGTGLGYWLAQLTQRKTNGGKSVTELRQEHEQFRDQVTEHFAETAQLVNQLTDSYKAVFDHLSSGAQQLADTDKLQQRLPPMDASAVSIQRVGYGPASAAPASAGDAAARPPQASQAQTATGAQQGVGSAPRPQQKPEPANSDAKADTQSAKKGQQGSAAARSAADKPGTGKTGDAKAGAGKAGIAQSGTGQPPASHTDPVPSKKR